ncbi:uncharacterized protein LOC121833418 [Ixodes scapularis]|uniref:uncharacterized protein LOC121833418 n=1 Tax=Ixodes scapularis TaxID=6945 RepID=UPI0011255E47|nr:uncharacterized protein LOC121833418 [Ixodes scapularis]
MQHPDAVRSGSSSSSSSSGWASARHKAYTLLGASVSVSLAVLGTYLTAAVHPGFLPVPFFALFVLCHVLVHPSTAKSCYFGPPVIRYAMPREFSYEIMVLKAQPDYMTVPVRKEAPPRPRPPVRVTTNRGAYCAPIVPSFQVPPVAIVVM